MAHTVIFNAELHIVEIKIQGAYRPSEGKEILVKTLEMVKAYDCPRTLADMREAQLKFSMQELYRVPNLVREVATNLGLPPFRKALVVQELTSEVRFFENVMLNRGQNVQIFLDIEKAKTWLLR